MQTSKTAIGYVRVSTDSQATEGVSLEAQKRRIQLWATANGYELLTVYTDAGLSGGRADNRPALQEALKRVIGGPSTLIVYSLSRLARSTKDTLSISERLDKAGADLVSLSEKIDTTSASGKMVFRLLAVLAEFEKDLISERTKASMSHMRRLNKLVGAVPYGFRLGRDRKSLIQDPNEQAVLQKVYTLRRRGKSLREIKETLERAGITAKNGGKVWHTSSLSYIIRNPQTQTGPNHGSQKAHTQKEAPHRVTRSGHSEATSEEQRKRKANNPTSAS